MFPSLENEEEKRRRLEVEAAVNEALGKPAPHAGEDDEDSVISDCPPGVEFSLNSTIFNNLFLEFWPVPSLQLAIKTAAWAGVGFLHLYNEAIQALMRGDDVVRSAKESGMLHDFAPASGSGRSWRGRGQRRNAARQDSSAAGEVIDLSRTGCSTTTSASSNRQQSTRPGPTSTTESNGPRAPPERQSRPVTRSMTGRGGRGGRGGRASRGGRTTSTNAVVSSNVAPASPYTVQVDEFEAEAILHANAVTATIAADGPRDPSPAAHPSPAGAAPAQSPSIPPASPGKVASDPQHCGDPQDRDVTAAMDPFGDVEVEVAHAACRHASVSVVRFTARTGHRSSPSWRRVASASALLDSGSTANLIKPPVAEAWTRYGRTGSGTFKLKGVGATTEASKLLRIPLVFDSAPGPPVVHYITFIVTEHCPSDLLIGVPGIAAARLIQWFDDNSERPANLTVSADDDVLAEFGVSQVHTSTAASEFERDLCIALLPRRAQVQARVDHTRFQGRFRRPSPS